PTGGVHAGEFTAQTRHVGTQSTAVRLDLRLTWTTQAHTTVGTGATTGLAREAATPATHTGDEVFHLGQRHLCLTLTGFGVLGEDVQHQHRAVHDLDVEFTFQRDQLGGAEFTVTDHGVRAGGLDDLLEFTDLTRADVGAGVRLVTLLVARFDDLGAGGISQGGEFGEAGIDLCGGAFGPHPDEDASSQAELSILHLVDVRGIVGVDGGFAAPDGLAVLEVEFTDRGGVTVLSGPLVSATTGRLGGDQTREVETGGFSNRLTLDMVVESLGEEVLVVNLVLFIHCSPLF